MQAATHVRLGDFEIRRIGLGSNRLTDTPEHARLLHAAVAAGVELIDTADVYTGGESERTLGRHLAPFDILVATKGGIVRGQPPNGRPDYLRRAVDASLSRLKVERIDLYQLHRPDPEVPIAESVGCLQELRQAGKLRHIGLSNVDLGQIQAARATGPIVSIQNEYSLAQRQHDEVLDYCGREGLIFLPYFPLTADGFETRLQRIAQRHEASQIQVILAWLLQRSPVMVPIPGTLSAKHLHANLQALQLRLDAEALTELGA